MTIEQALQVLREKLAKHVEHPRLETERLLCHALGLTQSQLLVSEKQTIWSDKVAFLELAVEKRSRGEPLAYILGHQGFYKCEFVVKPGVLIPRPETEAIIEAALRVCQVPPADIADFGSGSGCVGLSLLKEWPVAKLIAIDISEIAVQVTNENAHRLGVSNRCTAIKSDVVQWTPKQSLDLIVANPPYIDEKDERVEEHVRKYEPPEALFSGEQGLAATFAWSAHAKKNLRSNGWFILEIGAGQSAAVLAKLSELGFQQIEVLKDLAGLDRTVLARA